jgi:hypothetical protein
MVQQGDTVVITVQDSDDERAESTDGGEEGEEDAEDSEPSILFFVRL